MPEVYHPIFDTELDITEQPKLHRHHDHSAKVRPDVPPQARHTHSPLRYRSSPGHYRTRRASATLRRPLSNPTGQPAAAEHRQPGRELTNRTEQAVAPKTVDTADKSVGGPRYIQAILSLDDAGHVQVRTHTYCHIDLSGFTGGVLVSFSDVN